MSKKVYEESKIKAIADAIREKSGSLALYNTSEMPNGVNEVYEAGKQAEYDRFWDNFQKTFDGSVLEFCRNLFCGGGWNKENLKPKYKMTPTLADGMFLNCGIYASEPIDFSAIKDKFDFSKARDFIDTFSNAYMVNIDIDVPSQITNIARMFKSNSFPQYSPNHISLKVSETVINWTETFSYCINLTDLCFKDGSVISRSVDLSRSPLTVESMKSVMNALKDYSAIGGTYTLTLKKDRETMLTDEEKTVATNKGWTLVWS